MESLCDQGAEARWAKVGVHMGARSRDGGDGSAAQSQSVGGGQTLSPGLDNLTGNSTVNMTGRAQELDRRLDSYSQDSSSLDRPQPRTTLKTP